MSDFPWCSECGCVDDQHFDGQICWVEKDLCCRCDGMRNGAWKLGFRYVTRANIERALLWHKGGLDEWSISDWAVAAAGEMGEVCDAIKKLNRARDGIEGTRTATVEDVGDEIADTFLYLNLLAARLGLDLADLVEKKFNEVSRREGFDVYLPGGPQ